MNDPRVKADATRVAIQRLKSSTIGPRREGVARMKPPSKVQRIYEAMADFMPVTSELRALQEGDILGLAMSALIPGGRKLSPQQNVMKRLKETLRRVEAGEELKSIRPKRNLPIPRTKEEREFRKDLEGIEGTPLKKKP